MAAPALPPAATLRLVSPPIPPNNEEIDVEAEARILAAIEKLDGKVDGILQSQAGHAEWRKAVDEDRAHVERRLDDLEDADREREMAVVKIMAWAAGAGAVAGALAAIAGIVARVH